MMAKKKSVEVELTVTLINNETFQHPTDDLGAFLNGWRASGYKQFHNRIIPFHSLLSIETVARMVLVKVPRSRE
jgi:hypothetical protein